MAFTDSPWRTCSTAIVTLTTNATELICTVFRFFDETWLGLTGWLTERIAGVAAAMPPLRDGWSDAFRPSVMLVRARAFIERIAHRELRRFTPGWRACPSI